MLDITVILLSLPGIILSLALHEYVKAFAATRMGDPAPRLRGRLTLNPFKHLEPIGLICMVIFGFGWGNPTPISTAYFSNYKKSVLITHVAPMLTNFVVGVFAAYTLNLFNSPFYAGLIRGFAPEIRQIFSFYLPFVIHRIAFCNLSIAFFNLIPVVPLDGYRILGLYLHPNTVVRMSNYEKMFQIILIFLLMFGIIGSILNPISQALISLMIF